MIVTTYTCDKCGHEQTDTNLMWEVGVGIRRSQKGGGDTPVARELWGQACVVKVLGALPHDPRTGEERPDPRPTLDDMVREIIREETN